MAVHRSGNLAASPRGELRSSFTLGGVVQPGRADGGFQWGRLRPCPNPEASHHLADLALCLPDEHAQDTVLLCRQGVSYLEPRSRWLPRSSMHAASEPPSWMESLLL